MIKRTYAIASRQNVDRKTKEYKQWRAAVLKRDKKCKRCGVKRPLQAHHIIKWADSPELRYTVNNGITLCRSCHKKLWGHEESFVGMCRALLNPKSYIDIQIEMRKIDEQDE